MLFNSIDKKSFFDKKNHHVNVHLHVHDDVHDANSDVHNMHDEFYYP